MKPQDAAPAHRAGSDAVVLVPGSAAAGEALAVLSGSPVFSRFEPDDLAALAARPRALRRLRVTAGSDIVAEGDAALDLMVIVSGHAQVLKRSVRGEQHEVNRLGPGASIGELAVIDPAPRSATVRAVVDVELLAVPIADMLALAHQRPSFAIALLGTARQVVDLLRSSTNTAVESLQRSLDESRTRQALGQFTFLLIIAYTLYTWVLGTAVEVKQALGRSEFITVPFVLVCTSFLLYFMRSTRYPARFFGLTLENAGRDVLEAVLWTLPMLLGTVALKWWLVNHVPAMQGQPLLQMFGSAATGQATYTFNPWLTLAYLVFVPFQELIYRGGLQGSLAHFLTGRWRTVMAIVGSNVIFSAAHLYVSIGLSVTAFVAGLFWGWLYSRQHGLAGVSVSHLILGFFAFEVVGLGVLA